MTNKPDPRPIPDEATWQLLLEAYKKVKQDDDARLDTHDSALFQVIASSSRDGFHIAYEVRQTPDNKGRGLYCTEFLPKGTCVCDERSGRFYTENQWREFLTSLPHDLARDCVDWAGVDGDKKDDQVVFLDFSECCMLNHGSSKPRLWANLFSRQHKKKAWANVKGKYRGGMWHVYTTRDIQAGEELLLDYSLSHNYNHSLAWFEEIYDEYYPDTPHSGELKRWS